MIRRLGNGFLALGAAAFVAATAWWYAFYHEILGDQFQLARECFYWETPSCGVGRVVAIFMEVPAYDPMALWIAGGLLALGTLLRAFSHG